MVGVGVLTTTGVAARELSAREILLAWAAGGVLAIAGARAYAEAAQLVPRSGGEYRYLSELLHPAVGYFAGWVSLVVAFAAPSAVAAAAAGSFFSTLVPAMPPRLFGAALLAVVTLTQALDLSFGKATEDALAALKALLLGGFVALGLVRGAHALPAAALAPLTAAPFAAFAGALIYVTYAYSGWNTAVYAAEEFVEPRRTVPRAMAIGTACVTLFYLAVNWIFVTNLSHAELAGWTRSDDERVTLGHLLVQKLAGARAAGAMSVLVIVVLASSVISMALVGPRIAQTMAREGYLPRALAGRPGAPPRLAVAMQGLLALALCATHSFDALMRNAGAMITLSSLLTVLSLFRARFGTVAGLTARPRPMALVATAIFAIGSGWILWVALVHGGRPGEVPPIAWLGGGVALASIGYLTSRRARPL